MLSAIIENTVTKEDEYLYLKKENNNLTYYGFSIQNSNIKPIDKNIISKIYDLLRVNNKCIYIEDYLGYKVYLNTENGIKHYLKNGIEDFEMLYKNNGEDLNLYSNIEDLDDSDFNDIEIKYTRDGKKFKIGNFVIKLTFLALMSTFPFSAAKITAAAPSFIPKMVYSVSDYLNLDLHYIDCNEAMELIKSSSLSDIQKEIATNEILLKDIFEYYKGTDMEYVIGNRLNNVKTEIYSKDEGIKNGNIGYYSTFSPNVLHIREDVKGEDVFKHEFIHLLQSCNCEYMYLIEATAEIVSYEYLDAEINCYSCPVNNTRLLMNVIGPKMIWETVFGGDDTNLVNTLKNNLNESEAEELILYLKQTPGKIDEENKHERITELISNLYRNINLKDIKKDINIYGIYENHIDKIYFNEEKMQESWLIIDLSAAQELGLVTSIYDELYLKEISKEEYDKLNVELQNNPEYQKLSSSGMIDIGYQQRRLNKIKNIEVQYIPTNENISVLNWSPFSDFVILKVKTLKDGVFNEQEFPINIEEALEKGMITARYYEIVNGKNLTEIEKANYIWYSNILVGCEINNEKVIVNYDENGILENENIKYMVPTIKEIFSDQTIRNNNSIVK